MPLPRTFKMLSLLLALGTALAAPVQAQSLTQVLESARSYDAAWQAARAQLDASTSRADQARAGLLPSAALSAGLVRANTDIHTSVPVPLPNSGQTTQSLGVNASQPLYRPANRITLEQGLRGIDLAQQGFENVSNITGGSDAWSHEFDPLVPLY